VSNFLSIATATEALRQLLDATVKADVPGAQATSVRPAGPNGSPGPVPALGVNVYLYQSTPNAAYRNRDLPTRSGADSTLLQRPRAAIDLHYLLTFYGDDKQYEPQRLLGSVARILHAQPVLTRTQVAAAKGAFPFLAASDLESDVELVKLTPAALSLEELSKIWSVFFQTTYALSAAYQASVLLLEGSETPQEALPVKSRRVLVLPFTQPSIDQVLWQPKPGDLPVNDIPLLAGYTLLLQGQHFGPAPLFIRVGDQVLPATSSTGTRATLLLAEPPFPPDTLRAGPQAVQIIGLLNLGTPADPHRGLDSPVVAAVIAPTVKAVAFAAGKVTVTAAPTVGKSQRVTLLLNQIGGPLAYQFDTTLAADSATLVFATPGVAAGSYTVRVQVDGAESPLDLDLSGNYTGTPKVTVP
jgi:hypothetical protein